MPSPKAVEAAKELGIRVNGLTERMAWGRINATRERNKLALLTENGLCVRSVVTYGCFGRGRVTQIDTDKFEIYVRGRREPLKPTQISLA